MQYPNLIVSLASRRQFLLAGAAVLLTACSKTGPLAMARDTMALSINRDNSYPRTRAQIDALPYAQIGLRIGDGPRSIMVLSETVNGDLLWVSSNRVLIATRSGRIVRTVGLPKDIQTSLFLSPDFLAGYQPNDSRWINQRTLRSVDVVPGNNYQIDLRSNVRLVGPETITIAEQETETLKVEEVVTSQAWKWEATNTYWFSLRSGLVWRSVQHIAPGMDPVEIEVLKRAS